MKEIVFVLYLFVGIVDQNFAQIPDKFKNRIEQRRQEIENLKKDLVESRLNLKPEQVTLFRKLYDEYTLEKVEIRRKISQTKKNSLSLTYTDAELEKTIDELLILKDKEVEIEKNYKTKFLKVINVRQLAELYRSEQEFLRKLMGLLRMGGGGGKPLKKHPNNQFDED
jgi:hypothetical protein